jgi:glyoxylate/hydroxypyruvate reductase
VICATTRYNKRHTGGAICRCVRPLTGATRGLLGAKLFAALPSGASLVNVGRGPHLNQDDLLAALASGQLRNAILDVTDPEPLPATHALCGHPRVRMTPHIASAMRPDTAVDVLLENMRRHRAGELLFGEIDRSRGYYVRLNARSRKCCERITKRGIRAFTAMF